MTASEAFPEGTRVIITRNDTYQGKTGTVYSHYYYDQHALVRLDEEAKTNPSAPGIAYAIDEIRHLDTVDL